MKLRLSIFLLLAQLCLLSGTAVAQEPLNSNPANQSDPIYLQSSTFDPLQDSTTNAAAATLDQQLAAPAPENYYVENYYLVQFNGAIQRAWIQQVEALGGRVLGYIPENTHVVRMNRATLANLRSLPAVRWVGDYRPNYKLPLSLSQTLSAATSGQNSATGAAAPLAIDVYVVAFIGESLSDLQSAVVAQGGTIAEASDSPVGPVVRATIPASGLLQLAQYSAVNWIEPYQTMELFNAQGRKVMNAEYVWQDFGYYGSGQIIAISDSGLSVQGSLSADFAGRVIKAFAPSEMNLASPSCQSKTTFTDLNGHGTHVAGSVLGNGSASGSNPGNHQYTASHAGTAPEAQLVFMALNTDGSTGIQCIDQNGDFLARGYQNGARISSNSWGASDAGGYNIISSIVDNYVWQHKDYLVLYAAGNAGPGSQTIGSPGTAKNVLTIGASENDRKDLNERLADNTNEIAEFSSRGPTADGRVKPDVVAPGTWILSVRAAQAPDGSFWAPFNDSYAFMGGTSMATPLTAGSTALVREWLAKQRGINAPSAALMKAVMINGAVQLPGAEVADMNSGYGRVDLKNTLRSNYVVMDDFVQGLTTGQSKEYTIQVVTNTQQGLVVASAGDFAAPTVQAADAGTLHLTDRSGELQAAQAQRAAGDFQVSALPTSQKAHNLSPIPTNRGKDKGTPLSGPQLSQPLTATFGQVQAANSHVQAVPADESGTESFLLNYIGGGDFEDPDWTEYWQDVWLGEGIPERTDDTSLVIAGNYSMWLGGTAIEDSIWYPVQFPDKIDTSQTSGLYFKFDIYDEDPGFDAFCVALINTSGDLIGPYAGGSAECIEEAGNYNYSLEFTSSDLQSLAGESGYLVLYNISDGEEPHQSAIVDNIGLDIDFPDVELFTVPSAGPPGTTFLLVGKYNTPYGYVDICDNPCNADNYIDTVYADGSGNVAAFLYSGKSIAAGEHGIQTMDYYERVGNTIITIGDGSTQASLNVTPKSGPAGTNFVFTGKGFLPSDDTIAVTINGDSLGSVGSNSNGDISFEIQTESNTAPGDYTISATDSGGSSASAKVTVSAVSEDKPTLTVSPDSGKAGTTFVFQARNFTPSTDAEILIDEQNVGTATADEDGNLKISVETTTTTKPAQYTLTVRQGSKEASAQYVVTAPSGGGEEGSSGGFNITLVWTDPPAQTAASKTLINDLDLTVSGPAGLVYAGGLNAADHVNNVEVVRLANPPVGVYTIKVTAFKVNGQFGSQPFALVATRDYTAASAATVALAGGNLSPQKVYLPLVQRK